MSQPIPQRIPPEEYLARERPAAEKSEYLDGVVYAMAGASPEHCAIGFNLATEIGVQLRGKECRGFTNDMKVRTSHFGLYAYPDLSVVCGEPVFHDEHRDVLLNPTVLFEILSPSTEAFDRGAKWMRYQQIGSLLDYVMIAQHRPRIEHYARHSENRWLLTAAEGAEAEVFIASIECTFRLSTIYAGVEFLQSGEPQLEPPSS